MSLCQVQADQTWGGGSGTWDFNHTADWSGSPWTNNDQAAVFTSTPGTITIDNTFGQVGAQYLYFNTGTAGAWDVNGGTLDFSGNNNFLYFSDGGGTDNVTVDSNAVVDTTRPTDRYNIFSSQGVTMTLNGNMTFGGQSPSTDSTRTLIIGSGSNSAVFNINGTYTDSYLTGGVAIGLRLAEGGATFDTYNINGDISGLHGGLQIGSGTVVVSPTAVLNPGQIGFYNDQNTASENNELLTSGGANIANAMYISEKGHPDGQGNATLGVSDAHSSTFSGNIGLDNSGAILTAAANGRATFSGDFYGHSPNGLFKTGSGTVVLSTAKSYGLNNDFSSTPGTTAFDLQQGTVLITNTTGSAFGSSSGVVKIEAGAILGGTGTSTQQVVAVAATSTIAPGDAGQANLSIAPSIGTLHLADGLVAMSGLTLDFKINGSSYDQLDLGTGDLTLGGVTTVDFTNLGTVLTGPSHIYTFAYDGGVWSDTGGTFVLNAPAGYTIASDTFDTNYNQFDVEFAAVPEPSMWALMLGGFAFLGFCLHRKRQLS